MSAPNVVRHYGGQDLVEKLKTVIGSAGSNDGKLTAADLAPLDHFHTRGLAGTMELAEALALKASDRVLDVGSGLGGPSRFLATNYGVHVVGIDLSPAYVEAASFLADRTGLAGSTEYQCADALALPFAGESFEVVWTQHVAMNIANRDLFYSEMFRVLTPGGHLAIYDIVAREGQEALYPVPWSRTADSSFLLTKGEMSAALKGQGFEIDSWTDRTKEAVAWFAQVRASGGLASPNGLGLHLVMGPDWPIMAGNLARNLGEDRLALVEVVARRP